MSYFNLVLLQFGGRKRTPLVLAETLNAGLLREAAECKQDEHILMKIRDKDCVALEVRYHRQCYTNYTRFLNRPRIVTNDELYANAFSIFCNEVIQREIIEKKEIKYITELEQMFVSTVMEHEGLDASKYRRYLLKQRLKKAYPQLVFFTPRKRSRCEIVFVDELSADDMVDEHMSLIDLTQASDSIEDDMWDPSYNMETNELHVLYNAALILRDKIKNHPDLNLPWPPLATDITNKNAINSVPIETFNVLAWICGFSTEPTLDEFVKVKDNENKKLLSIAQDLMFVASHGKRVTPKGIALGVAIRQITGSAAAVSLVNNLGHCMSHSFLLSHETALAQLNISSLSILPPGFENNVSTTIAWDNDDFSEETRTGKGTTHITGGVIIQRLQPTHDCPQERVHLPRSRSLKAPSDQISPYVTGKKVTVNLLDAASTIHIDEESHKPMQEIARKSDIAFTISRFIARNDGVFSNWTGFNTKIESHTLPSLSKIGYLPVIDASPTEMATVNEILKRSWAIADKLELKYLSLVFDEAIYAKIQIIRWKKQEYMNRFIVRLGDFHMAMSFCGAISKLFKDAGLKVS